jgi:hypothetical protein
LVSAFTICAFNTKGGVKVTQNRPKKFFYKIRGAPGYLLTQSGINLKFHHKKQTKMKKLLFVLALGAFAACGSGDTKTTTTDSSATVDSSKAASVDTTAKAADTTKKASADTAAKK